MHGLGNDFMLIDAACQDDDLTLPPPATAINRWADRRYGVGFDQLIYLFRNNDHIRYQFFNADGSPAEQCGNGQRAIALYLNNGQHKMPMTIDGSGGPVQLNYRDDDCITASFEQAYHHDKRQLSLLGAPVTAYVVDVGNPHCVVISGDIAIEPLAEKAALISAYFSSGVNVEVMQIMADNHVKIRIYERGTGETRACGSGAAAAAIVLRHYFDGKNEITISMPGGDLQVSLSEACDKMTLIGPARSVYQGQIYD
jgi:diaminopimelate epimerase